MGAGKSTVGKLLAALLEYPFVDLDEVIVQRESRSIAEIFASDGEEYFRDCESSVLDGLGKHPSTIYATGGGIILRDVNRRKMNLIGRIVYLKADWATLKVRLLQSAFRPLANPDNGWDEVEKRWIERQSCYEEADLVVDTGGDSPLEVAKKIVAELTS